MGFVHLRVQSDYSFLRSVMTVEDIANSSHDTIALTDNQLHGVFSFFDAMKNAEKETHKDRPEARKKAIYGLNQKVENAILPGASRILLIAKNKQGLEQLMVLNSRANERENECATYEEIQQLSDVFVLVGSLSTEIGELVARKRDEEASLLTRNLHDHIGDRMYFEIQHHHLVEPWETRCLRYGLKQTLLPLVLTNECVYEVRENAVYQRILLASEKDGYEFHFHRFDYGDEFYLKSPAEMMNLVDEIEMLFENGHRAREAYENTGRIANEIESIDLAVSGYFMPETPNALEELKKRVYERLPERYPNTSQEVIDRIEYELKVMDEMGFAGYFIILDDIVSYAHSVEIMMSPGRGSAAGSAVMYVLGVTDVEPLQFDLLFERFLNPERITMPDVDLDFDGERREEVINYIVERFGQDKVAQIANFSELSGKSAVRMVSESFGLPPFEKDRVSKLIQSRSLEEALQEDLDFITEYQNNETVKRIVDFAIFFDNKSIKTHAGVHAAGIVISSVPLEGMVPTIKGNVLSRCVGIDMAGVEVRGLIKYDILGLKLLTAIQKCFRRITDRTFKKLSDIPMDDPKVFEFIASGQTAGMFQLSKAGNYCKDIQISNMDDIIAINALNRPGPKQFIPNYVNRKFGRERAEYYHESLEPVLMKTYGIIIYQEQIQQLAQIFSGYTLGQADLLRRAVSKKKDSVLAKEREHFVQGALALGHTKEMANMIYDFIVPFAEYGFNKSHATAYAIAAYCTAFLKLYYPTIFMAAMIEAHSGEEDDKDTSPKNLRLEAEKMGIRFLQPDVNYSDVEYTPYEEEKTIRFGLRAVKGCGAKDSEKIVENRPYADFKDFIRRSCVGKRSLLPLVQSGAFDTMEERGLLLPVLDQRVEVAKEEFTIFDFVQLDDAPKVVSRMEYLKMEREVLSSYVSGHPMEMFQNEWKRERALPLADLGDGFVKVCGILTSFRWWKSKQGGHATIEDGDSSVEIGLGQKIIGQLTEPVDSLKDAFVVIDGKRNGERFFANSIRWIKPDTITETKLVEDSPQVRKALLRAKKGTVEVLLISESGYKVFGCVTWTEELEKLKNNARLYTAS